MEENIPTNPEDHIPPDHPEDPRAEDRSQLNLLYTTKGRKRPLLALASVIFLGIAFIAFGTTEGLVGGVLSIVTGLGFILFWWQHYEFYPTYFVIVTPPLFFSKHYRTRIHYRQVEEALYRYVDYTNNPDYEGDADGPASGVTLRFTKASFLTLIETIHVELGVTSAIRLLELLHQHNVKLSFKAPQDILAEIRKHPALNEAYLEEINPTPLLIKRRRRIRRRPVQKIKRS